ncbi:MAG: hypothetical protein JWM11_479 [Planctomycetaceae bacterium]|nr:hypothetical protein [Planctomycetaceae bacterium]
MNNPAMPSSPDIPSDSQQRIGHEISDANPFYVSLFAIALILAIALVFPLMSWMFWRFEAAAKRSDSPLSVVADKQSPPPPTLQDNPAADLLEFRRAEDQRLSSYGWIDQRQGIVRLPVDRAITILSERGLPEPQGPPVIPPALPPPGKERQP